MDKNSMLYKVLDPFMRNVFVPIHKALLPKDYDPRNAPQWKPYPQKVEDKPKTKKKDTDNSKRFNTVAMRYETHTQTDNGADEWVLHGHEKDRTEQLTERDKQILTERGLENLMDKARIIKPFWAQHMSRKMIAFELNRLKVQGCKEATIGKVCAALSYSNNEIEA